jgi:hypothetical protein
MTDGYVAGADFTNFAPEPFLGRVRHFLTN